ncbi:MAG: tetratricopeptide repeat protein [Cyclobacteriaceae bacterium]|nr:tetratricopeptide repeat protein [Cyclobacteriaceae bacterium]MDW8331441.1 tetratricopeptide repeat protein [Cyclobacteriaceae bacterium]
MRKHVKAGLPACLFLLLFYIGKAQSVALPPAQQAFQLILDLRTDEARRLIEKMPPPRSIYLASLADMLEMFVREDPGLFSGYENNFEKRLDELSRLNVPSAEKMYTLAELRLQWAFINLKFGNELQAAWQLRQSYLAAQSCRQKYPHYEPIRKTWGVLNLTLGSVPEKYQWVLRMLNLNGSVETGLRELNRTSRASDNYGTEALILLSLAQSYLLQQNEMALANMETLIKTHPQQAVYFMAAAIALKSSQGKKALAYVDSLLSKPPLQIPYTWYIRGEALLSAGRYEEAATAYQQFIQSYPGENFVKDAWYKTGVCYALMNDNQQAETCFFRARSAGDKRTEADRYADSQLSESPWPHPVISRLRFATDGGYYAEALSIVQQHASDSFPSGKDSVEFIYRTARLFHQLNQTDTCLYLYKKTIERAGYKPWYFAPNACLQTGYILQQRGQLREAEMYFRKALSYPRHPYKNSIDSKAKSALTQLTTK